MKEGIIEQFISAMKAAGLVPTEPIAARLGFEVVRFRCVDDPPEAGSSWAILVLDNNPTGAFGHYSRGIHGAWQGVMEGDTA